MGNKIKMQSFLVIAIATIRFAQTESRDRLDAFATGKERHGLASCTLRGIALHGSADSDEIAPKHKNESEGRSQECKESSGNRGDTIDPRVRKRIYNHLGSTEYADKWTDSPHRQSRRKLYANVDWTQPQYYDTSKSIAVGTNLYYITRGVDGLFIDEFNTLTTTWRSLPQYSWLTDADGWDVEMRYATIRAASVGSNLYVFGRGATGTYLSRLDTSTDTWTLMPTFAFLRDADGFSLPEFYQTVRMVSCGTSLYITCRGNNQLNMASFDTATNTWTLRPVLYQFVDDLTWSQYIYYATFRLAADSVNRLWLFCRGPNGINLAPYDTTINTWGSLVTYVFFDDANWFYFPRFFETIDIVPYSTRVHIISRGFCCVYQYYYNTITSTFSVGSTLNSYSDAEGWTSAEYYMTLKFTLCNSVLYVDGRGQEAVFSTKYTYDGWNAAAVGTNLFTDADGWNAASYYRSLRCVCIGSKLYYVGRKEAVVQLAVYDTVTNSWSSVPEFFYPCHNTCKDCSGNLPTSCTLCYPFSHLQSTSPSACVCDSHYFAGPVSPTCSACDGQCAECSGSTASQCSQCPANAALSSTAPSSCKCASGYYFETNNVCTTCHQRCKECTAGGIDQCTQCKTNSHLQTSPLSECVCDSGFYFNGSNVCTGCHATCKECSNSGSSDCTQCKTNASLTAPSTSSCKCTTGYYMDATNICAQCHPSCKDCSGSGTALCTGCPIHAHLATPPTSSCDCDLGYFYDVPSTSCLSCHSSCEACTGTGESLCTQCPANSYLSNPPTSSCACSSGYYMVTPAYLCTLCDPTCEHCSDGTASSCTQCHSNAYLTAPPTSSCECNSGYTMNASGVCAGCAPTCAACTSAGATSCTQCPSNSALVSPPVSACECNSGYYREANNECSLCHARCKECTGDGINQCTSCNANSQLDSPPTSQCSCVSGFFFDVSDVCLACHQSCAECAGGTVTECTQCKSNAALTTPSVSSCACSIGFFMATPAYVCNLCDLSCQFCNDGSASSCTQCYSNAHLATPPISACECNTGFYMSPANVCILCNPTCAACSSAGAAACTQCTPNSALVSPPVSTCSCNSGYYRKANNVCTQCYFRCKECSAGGVSDCTQCKSNAALVTPPTSGCQCNTGYYMDASGVCQSCSSPCAACAGPLQCSQCISSAHLVTPPTSACECDSGLTLDSSSSSCVQCHATCLACSGPGPNMCTSCKANANLQVPPTSACLCDSGFFMAASGACSGCYAACLTCSGSGQSECLSCRGDLVLSDPPNPSECVCPASYYPIGANSCGACYETCNLCSGPLMNQCTQCKSNSGLQVDGTCLCDERYFWNKATSACDECHSSCVQCNGNAQANCLKCFPNAFISHTSAGVCLCNPGFYPLSGNVAYCYPCPSLCSICSSSEECIECSKNAVIVSGGVCECSAGFFYDSDYNRCIECQKGCATCVFDSECLTCKSDFKFHYNLCVETCPSGFIESGLRCVPEPPAPSLSVDTSNTLTLTFSKQVSKEVEASDIELSVIDLDGTSIPLYWSISTIDSYRSFLIPLTFYQVTPPDNSTLYLSFLNPSDFCGEDGTPMAARSLNVTLYPYPKDTVIDSGKSPKNTQAATAASTIAQSGIATTAVASILSGNPTGFFGLLNQLQLITYIPLMDLELPDDLFYTLIGLNANGFSYNPFDTLFESERNATQPKMNAQNYGFSSTLFLKNSGFISISLITVAVSYLTVITLSRFRFSPAIALYFSGITEKFYWCVPMRLWIQLYLDIGVNTLLQFSTASAFDCQWDLILNVSISAPLLSLFAITPILAVSFIFNHRKLMLRRSDLLFNMKWGVFYMEFKESNREGALLYYALFLIRRLLYAMALILLWDFSVLQMTVNVLFSIVVRFI